MSSKWHQEKKYNARPHYFKKEIYQICDTTSENMCIYMLSYSSDHWSYTTNFLKELEKKTEKVA